MTTQVKRRGKLTTEDLIELERLRIEGNHGKRDNDTILTYNGIELTPKNIYGRIGTATKRGEISQELLEEIRGRTATIEDIIELERLRIEGNYFSMDNETILTYNGIELTPKNIYGRIKRATKRGEISQDVFEEISGRQAIIEDLIELERLRIEGNHLTNDNETILTYNGIELTPKNIYGRIKRATKRGEISQDVFEEIRGRQAIIEDLIELERLRIEGNHPTHDNETILEYNGIELTPKNIYGRIGTATKRGEISQDVFEEIRGRQATIEDLIELERLRIEGNHPTNDNDTILEYNGIELTPKNIYGRIGTATKRGEISQEIIEKIRGKGKQIKTSFRKIRNTTKLKDYTELDITQANITEFFGTNRENLDSIISEVNPEQEIVDYITLEESNEYPETLELLNLLRAQNNKKDIHEKAYAENPRLVELYNKGAIGISTTSAILLAGVFKELYDRDVRKVIDLGGAHGIPSVRAHDALAKPDIILTVYDRCPVGQKLVEQEKSENVNFERVIIPTQLDPTVKTDLITATYFLNELNEEEIKETIEDMPETKYFFATLPANSCKAKREVVLESLIGKGFDVKNYTLQVDLGDTKTNVWAVGGTNK